MLVSGITRPFLLLSTKKKMRTLSQESTVVENKSFFNLKDMRLVKGIRFFLVVGHLSCQNSGIPTVSTGFG